MNSKFYRFLVISAVSAFLLTAVCPDKSSAKKLFGGSDGAKKSAPVKKEAENKSAAEAANVLSSGAIIKFDKPIYDFGNVTPDSINDCSFKFTNIGTGTLEITGTKGTCKCTVPNLKKNDYAPGESGEITVSFHAPKFQGLTTQSVYVTTNDPNNSRIELGIKANVLTQVQVEPEKMSLSLLEPNGGAKEITLKSIDNERYAITKITSAGDVFTFDFDPNNVSDTHTLKPKVNVDALRHYLSGSVLIEITHPACKAVKVDYSCMREFEASPAAIIIRNAVEGKAQRRTIYLTSNYNEKIVVDSAASDKGIIKVISQKQTENRFEFEVEITPPLREGKLRVFSDTLYIKIKDKEPINIPCRGFFSPSK
jgi:hypothetical protein